VIPLFAKYPNLRDNLPYVSVADLPTPVARLERLGAQLDIELFVKRDDLTGKIYGGNKVRKLEFLLGKALQEGRSEVITFGAVGSNHALATAIYADQLGLGSINMLVPQPNAKYVRENLLMSHAIGAELHHYGNDWAAAVGTGVQMLSHKMRRGQFPAFIFIGGTTPYGMLGFVNAALELEQQIAEGQMPVPDYIYVAMGSMGTSTGLAFGLRAAGLPTKVVPVRVVPDKYASLKKFTRHWRKLQCLLAAEETFATIGLGSEDYAIRDRFFGGEYARFTAEGQEAARRMWEAEGLNLEGTYTAKALAALIDDANRGVLKGKTVLFWNTANSVDFSDSIAHLDYRELPAAFHRYFEEDLQPLDLK
jgi:1-aminocyclopropane-1-carboxylate deaminase/D-cysteine desulfhydrase-like pyridoxal-dependent ACC family enzyme